MKIAVGIGKQRRLLGMWHPQAAMLCGNIRHKVALSPCHAQHKGLYPPQKHNSSPPVLSCAPLGLPRLHPAGSAWRRTHLLLLSSPADALAPSALHTRTASRSGSTRSTTPPARFATSPTRVRPGPLLAVTGGEGGLYRLPVPAWRNHHSLRCCHPSLLLTSSCLWVSASACQPLEGTRKVPELFQPYSGRDPVDTCAEEELCCCVPVQVTMWCRHRHPPLLASPSRWCHPWVTCT